MTPHSIPVTWNWSHLAYEVQLRDEKVDPAKEPGERFLYIGLEDIESGTGQLNTRDLARTEGADIQSLKNAFYKGDVLYGRLRPALNKVYVAESDGICSTDIWVLRSGERLSSEYLFNYLKQPLVCERLSQLALGGQLPRVPRDAFGRLPIPIPTIPEQQRVVGILGEADALQRRHREILDRAKQLPAALFLEVFGDPENWGARKVKLGDIATFVTSGSRDWSKYYSSSSKDAKFIRVQNIKAGELDLADMAYVRPPMGTEADRAKVQPGDLLISITGTVGQVTIAPENLGEAYISQHVALVRTDGAMPINYLVEFLNHPAGGQLQIQRATYGQTKPGLNLQQIRTLLVPLFDPKKIERSIAARDEIASLTYKLETSIPSIVQLQHALLRQAFNGELTKHWRQAHRAELEKWLAEHAQPLPKATARIAFTETPSSERTAPTRPARHWLMDKLSPVQGHVYLALEEWKGTLIPSEDLGRFLDEWPIEHFEDAHDQALRALNQLAGLGLIARVSIPSQLGEYVSGYRVLREEELTKADDLQRLGASA